MSKQDALWLDMDRPGNLMVIDSLVWTDEPLDWERVAEVAYERLWSRYSVFRSATVRDDGRWYWQEVDDQAFGAHLTHVELDPPGGDDELRAFVGAQRSAPLDEHRPRWQMYCIDGYRGGSAVLTRTHHAIADGIRMVQIAMSLFDATSEGGALLGPADPTVPADSTPSADPPEQAAGTRSPLEILRADLRAIGAELGRPVNELGHIVERTARDIAKVAERSTRIAADSITNPLGAAHSAVNVVRSGVGSVTDWMGALLQPVTAGPVVDVFASSPGDVDFVRKILLGTRNDVTIWTGKVGVDKRMSWSPPLSLADVKDVARRHDATVNDVLVTCVAGALHAYLTTHDASCTSTTWMVPVNLRPIDLSLPEELGNEFAVVQLELPTNSADLAAILAVVKRRMGRIKHGHEAALAFRIQEAVSGLDDTLYRGTVDLLAGRATGVLTNVPGPPMPVYLAGRRVEGMVGWAPLSGNQPISFTIYSYDGKVFVGIACDEALVPDGHEIVDGFARSFERLSSSSVPGSGAG